MPKVLFFCSVCVCVCVCVCVRARFSEMYVNSITEYSFFYTKTFSQGRTKLVRPVRRLSDSRPQIE